MPIVISGGYRGLAIGFLTGGCLCSAFFAVIDEFREIAFPIFLIAIIVGLLAFVDSFMPMVKIDEDRISLYTGFLKRTPTILIDRFNVESVELLQRDRKIKLRTALMIGSITGEMSEEVLLLRLKAPPEISSLNRLRIMRNRASAFFKYALGDTDSEVLIRIPPKGGFPNLLRMLSAHLNLARGS